MKDTNVVLKYRRPEDCWICPNCDSENKMTNGFCSVCGTQYVNYSTTILRHWVPEDDRPHKPHTPPIVTTPGGGMGGGIEPPRSTPHSKTDDESKGKIIGAVFAVVMVLIVLIAIIANRNAATSAIDASYDCPITETGVVDYSYQPYDNCGSVCCTSTEPLSHFV